MKTPAHSFRPRAGGFVWAVGIGVLCTFLIGRFSEAAPDASVTKQRVTFRNDDNHQLVGFLFKPDGLGRFPAIVWNHGSEENPGAGLQFDTVASIFVNAGFVVFAPMRRGHGQSEGDHVVSRINQTLRSQGIEAANRQTVHLLESEQLDDQFAGLSYLKKFDYVDPDRLVAAGCSYGGIQSLLAAERPDGYKAAIAISPGALSWDRNPYLQQRLIQAARSIVVPVLLLQPAKDASLEPTRVLGAELKRFGKPYSAKIYPPIGPEQEQSHCFGGARGVHVWKEDALSFALSAIRTSK